MEQFVTLYFNEIRNMKRELLIILATISVYLLFRNFLIIFIDIDFINPSPLEHFFLVLFDYWLYLFPILFVYSLYRGEKKQSLYQEDSHLINKHNRLLIKFLIFVDTLILVALILTVNYLLLIYNILPRQKIAGGAIADPRVFISGLLGAFKYPFITLSLICTAWGVMQIVKRFRLYLGLAVVITGLLLYFILVGIVVSYAKTFIENVSYVLLFTLCLGSIFCAVGVYLYNKFGEVKRIF